MSKRLLVLLALCGLSFTTAPAQDPLGADTKTEEVAPKSAARRAVARTAAKTLPAPVATPAPVKKEGFFQRIFRPRQRSTPTPATPAPEATPAPRKPRRPVSATPAPEVAEPETGEPKATPAPKKGRNKRVVVADKKGLPPAPPANADPEVLEKYKYDVARSTAMEDPGLQQLKARADTASTDEEALKAQRAYSRELFDKMREIDSSLKDRLDRMEAALMKRLENQPPAPQ